MNKYDVVGFDNIVHSRIRKSELKSLQSIIRKCHDKYANQSQFIRCAIIKLSREERKRLKI